MRLWERLWFTTQCHSQQLPRDPNEQVNRKDWKHITQSFKALNNTVVSFLDTANFKLYKHYSCKKVPASNTSLRSSLTFHSLSSCISPTFFSRVVKASLFDIYRNRSHSQSVRTLNDLHNMEMAWPLRCLSILTLYRLLTFCR